ncbi:MAG: bifunctional nicotinamidase/pyrazinamidase [Treponema sp.]|nr:bifunctional nicotinamidase/pyrazinamidase [Treponema sp.]
MPLDMSKTVLLIIDVQNDFCPAYTSNTGGRNPPGALAVRDGCDVVAPLNSLAAAVAIAGGRVAATQDWHPGGHVSFASSHQGKKAGDRIDLAAAPGQVLWPGHCVQGTWGAAFHDRLDLNPISLIVRKGFRRDLDSYSAFFENDRKTPTGLEGWIRSLDIQTVILGGLATDYCVRYSALDARRLGFTTIIASDAVRGVGYPEGSVEQAIDEMKAEGIRFALSAELMEDIR